MKARYYYKNVGDLATRLRDHIAADDLRELSRVSTVRHMAIVLRHVALYLGCATALFFVEDPWIWIPIAALQGTVILGFIILLHEQVHEVIFARRRPKLMRCLGLFYAFPSLISATQFRLWHLDHHRELGSSDDDPKRAHLSPKRNARWFKLLYMTPVLFLIYARAAGCEARGYSAADRRIVRRERLANILLHVGLIALLSMAGWDVFFRVWFVPLFLFFPPAFMINRIGQHYDINPEKVEGWSTLVNGNPLIRFLFLHSNHHIEHHYYPSVPFYNLARLNRLLRPFFRQYGIQNRTYRDLLWGWFVDNRAPHTNWSETESVAVTTPAP